MVGEAAILRREKAKLISKFFQYSFFQKLVTNLFFRSTGDALIARKENDELKKKSNK